MRRVALVTGATRGIGREIALALAREGLSVAVTARSVDQVEKVAAEARALGVAAEALALDVTDPDAVAAAPHVVASRLGAVDVLVNNAGVAESSPLVKAGLAQWDRHLRVNATGPFVLTRYFLPRLRGRGCGGYGG